MRIGIVARSDLPDVVKFTQKMLKFLSKADVVLEQELAKKLGKQGEKVQHMRVDAIITAGGDGTVLSVLQHLPNVPILGINMGSTGFLADVLPSDAEAAIKKLLAGELRVQQRARLATEVGGKRLPDALNEAVVTSAVSGKTIAFRTILDGRVVYSARGDGLIVATPTGSTAYALAAGGPIVDPRLEVLLLVPVCVTRPRISPIVLPSYSRIEVELTRPDRKALVIIDGQSPVEVEPNDKLVFYLSENQARFFEWREDFYRKIEEKL